jgi:hypothetical protein
LPTVSLVASHFLSLSPLLFVSFCLLGRNPPLFFFQSTPRFGSLAIGDNSLMLTGMNKLTSSFRKGNY